MTPVGEGLGVVIWPEKSIPDQGCRSKMAQILTMKFGPNFFLNIFQICPIPSQIFSKFVPKFSWAMGPEASSLVSVLPIREVSSSHTLSCL